MALLSTRWQHCTSTEGSASSALITINEKLLSFDMMVFFWIYFSNNITRITHLTTTTVDSLIYSECKPFWNALERNSKTACAFAPSSQMFPTQDCVWRRFQLPLRLCPIRTLALLHPSRAAQIESRTLSPAMKSLGTLLFCTCRRPRRYSFTQFIFNFFPS